MRPPGAQTAGPGQALGRARARGAPWGRARGPGTPEPPETAATAPLVVSEEGIMAKESKVTPRYLLGIWPQSPERRSPAARARPPNWNRGFPDVGRPRPTQGGPALRTALRSCTFSRSGGERQERVRVKGWSGGRSPGMKAPSTGAGSRGTRGPACLQLASRSPFSQEAQAPSHSQGLLEGAGGARRGRKVV